MTGESHPLNKGELEYGSVLPNGEDWRLWKFDAGMGEKEYRIFRNETFFAMFDNRQDADVVMVAMTCSDEISEKVLEEILDLIDGRYEGMKGFYETLSDQRTGTDREAQLMFEEVKIIKDCVDIILEHSGLAELRQQEKKVRL